MSDDKAHADDLAVTQNPQVGEELLVAGYRVVRRLGEGGMGVVYEAEQQSPRRLVALKVIRGSDYIDEHQVKLFQREVQALARLRHPGIAAIYEAGRTAQGRHFFAMEIVRGMPLGEFLRQTPPGTGRLWLQERLALFLKICDAISYAHRRGVIHRDLKPSNIVVSSVPAAGEPSGARFEAKVLDFGLAHITESDVTLTTTATAVGKIQGTLSYMSPEQACGQADEIDLRCDVYSLGVLLYEMLAGRLPYDVRRAMIHEAVRVICEEPPKRPGAIARALRGDLETIMLQALEKDPARRYQSTLALAGDIERYLANQPILARPPSAVYQLRKLVGRHKIVFSFAGVLALLLVTFAVVMSVMFDQQRRQREWAEIERAKAEQISSFLQEMLASVNPEEAQGLEVTVREVLDAAAERVGTGLATQPAVQAAVRTTIGNSYRGLGLYDQAEEQLRAALAAREAVWGGDHLEVAAVLSELTMVLYYRGESAQAEEFCRRALSIQRAQLGEDHPDVAESTNNLAMCLHDQGKSAAAEELYRRVVAMVKRHYGPQHVYVAHSLHNLATALHDQRKYAAAEPLYREALDLQRAQHGPAHPAVATSLSNLATLLQDQGRYTEAEPLCRGALAQYRQFLGEEHPHVATAYHCLARLKHAQGDTTEVEHSYRRALEIRRQALGDRHLSVASTLHWLGAFLHARRQDAEAAGLLRDCLAIRQAAQPPDALETAQAENLLGGCLSALGRSGEAARLLRASFPVIMASPRSGASARRDAVERMRTFHEAHGDPDSAAHYARLRERVLAPEDAWR